jgi:hypothetical protein
MAELIGAFLVLALPIRILLDSKKRLGKLRWTWAIIMFLLCSTFMAAWIDFLYAWIVINFFGSQQTFIVRMGKFLVMFAAFECLFNIYRSLNKEALAISSQASDDSSKRE